MTGISPVLGRRQFIYGSHLGMRVNQMYAQFNHAGNFLIYAVTWNGMGTFN